jgi:hypothetical protein
MMPEEPESSWARSLLRASPGEVGQLSPSGPSVSPKGQVIRGMLGHSTISITY